MGLFASSELPPETVECAVDCSSPVRALRSRRWSSAASPGGDLHGQPHPWRAYQGNSFVDRARWEELFQSTWELDRHEAEAWTLHELDGISRLAKHPGPMPRAAAHRLWRGVPDSFKGTVWAAVARAPAAGPDADNLYERAKEAAFGEQVPRRFERCPSFDEDNVDSGEVELARRVPFHSLLAPEGMVAAQRLLWCCSQLWHSQVEYCPVLPVLAVLLLIFFESEAAAYAVLSAVLERATEDWNRRDRMKADWDELAVFPFLPLTTDQWAEVATRTVKLAEKWAPQVVYHMRALKVDVEAIAERALREGLAHQLPFRAVCRAYGAFLAEGTEVFVRMLVVLWRQHREDLCLCETREAAELALLPRVEEVLVFDIPRRPRGRGSTDDPGSPSCSPTSDAGARRMLGVDDLVRLALRLHLPKSLCVASPPAGRLRRIGSNPDVRDPECRVFCRPRLRGEPSHIVWEELWSYLWQWLPPLARIRDPVQCFATHKDGYTLSCLLAHCLKVPPDVPMLVVLYVCVEDGTTAVLGAYLPAAIRLTGAGYLDLAEYGHVGAYAADAYIFRVVGTAVSHGPPQAWHYSAHNELLLHAPAADSVALQVSGESPALCIGGDAVALSMDSTLGHGSTSTSATFDSPPLLPTHCQEGEPGWDCVEYRIVDVEVYELD